MQHTFVWHGKARKRSSKNGRGQLQNNLSFPINTSPRGTRGTGGPEREQRPAGPGAEAARALPGGRARRRGPEASARPRAAPVPGTARSLPAAALTCPGPGRA